MYPGLLGPFRWGVGKVVCDAKKAAEGRWVRRLRMGGGSGWWYVRRREDGRRDVDWDSGRCVLRRQ